MPIFNIYGQLIYFWAKFWPIKYKFSPKFKSWPKYIKILGAQLYILALIWANPQPNPQIKAKIYKVEVAKDSWPI